MTIWDRMVAFNEKLNGLPRKGMLVAFVLLATYLLVITFPLFMPFFIAGVIAFAMEPLVKMLRRLLGKVRMGKAIATILAMVLVYGIVGFITFSLVKRIFVEVAAFAKNIPSLTSYVSIKADELIALLNTNYADILPDNFPNIINNLLAEITKGLTSLAGTLSKYIATGAFSTVISLPEAILSVVLTIMGSFYLSYDKERIFAFFRRSFPNKLVSGAISIKNNIFTSVFGQIKSQLIVSALITITVIIGLTLMQRDYSLVLGLLIGIADALPVIGAGLFLITWAIIAFITGDTVIGVGMLVLYLVVILVRQISEPRIVGHNLGLYPLATMMSLFAGFKLMGFLGMLVGPIILNVLKVVLAADEAALNPPIETPSPDAVSTTKRKRQRNSSRK